MMVEEVSTLSDGKKTSTGKTVAEQLEIIDLNKIAKQAAQIAKTNPGLADAMNMIGQQIAMESMAEFQRERDFRAEERELRREQNRLEQMKLKQQMATGDLSGNQNNALNNFLEGFKNPEFVQWWASLDPEAQSRMLLSLQMTGGMGNNLHNQNNMVQMMQMMMLMNQNQKPKTQEWDFPQMLTLMETMRNNAIVQTSQQSSEIVNILKEQMKQPEADPIQTMGALIEVMKPFVENKPTSTLRDQLEDLAAIANAFGGGERATGPADIELAKVQAQTQYNMQHLALEARKMAMEQDADARKYEVLGGIVSTAASAAGPQIMEAIKAAAANSPPPQMHQAPQNMGGQNVIPPGIQPQSIRPPRRTPQGGIPVDIQCNVCGGHFQISVPSPDKIPSRIQCQECGEWLSSDGGEEPDENDGPGYGDVDFRIY